MSIVSAGFIISLSAVVRGAISEVTCDTCALELIENGGCVMFSIDDNSEEDGLSKYGSSECSFRVDCLSDIEVACKERCSTVNIPECNFKNCCSGDPLALCYTMECMADYAFCCDLWAEEA